MHRLRRSLIAATSLAASAAASVTTTVDLVDPSDSITQPPPGIIAIDVLVDVSSDDVWTAAGTRVDVTPAGQATGVHFVYGTNDDPNTIQPEHLLNPGTDNRFITFFSRPRGRDANARYTNSGAAIAGRYSSQPPVHIATPFVLDLVWFASPPPSSTTPSFDGAIARIVLDVTELLVREPTAIFIVGDAASAEGPIIVNSSTDVGLPGTASVSFRNPNITGLDWAVWYIPEPTPLVSVIAGAGLLFRRR